jgi:hypothetical protein
MNIFIAQKIKIDGQEIQGPLDPSIVTISDLIGKVVGFIMPLALIILFFVFVAGGYDFILSRGNPERVKSAKAKLTTGIIGFVLLVSSYVVVRIIATVFGLDGGVL